MKSNIGNSYNKLGNYSKAATYMEKALDILISAYGEEHANVAVCYYNAGVLYKKEGNYQKALELSEKALSILSKFLPEGHPTLKKISDGVEEISNKIKRKN